MTPRYIVVIDRATATILNWFRSYQLAYEQRDMSGSLFRNDKREKDTHPNARGSCKINGVDYYVDAWTKKDKNGDPWQSLSFKKKDAPKVTPKPGQTSAKPLDDSDEIPF